MSFAVINDTKAASVDQLPVPLHVGGSSCVTQFFGIIGVLVGAQEVGFVGLGDLGISCIDTTSK